MTLHDALSTRPRQSLARRTSFRSATDSRTLDPMGRERIDLVIDTLVPCKSAASPDVNGLRSGRLYFSSTRFDRRG
jgi:hypothetical protein